MALLAKGADLKVGHYMQMKRSLLLAGLKPGTYISSKGQSGLREERTKSRRLVTLGP